MLKARLEIDIEYTEDYNPSDILKTLEDILEQSPAAEDGDILITTDNIIPLS